MMIKPLEVYALSKIIIAAIATIVFAYIALFWPFGDEIPLLSVGSRFVSGILSLCFLLYACLSFDEFIHDKYGR